jgi:hypothetical protein
LEILYDDTGIEADVTTTKLSIEPTRITTAIYGSIRAHYTYGDELVLVQYPNRRRMKLNDKGAAENAIGDEPQLPEDCERGIAGAGQTLFSIDRIYHDFENRYLWP